MYSSRARARAVDKNTAELRPRALPQVLCAAATRKANELIAFLTKVPLLEPLGNQLHGPLWPACCLRAESLVIRFVHPWLLLEEADSICRGLRVEQLVDVTELGTG